jgi:hypothetical protein
MTSKCASIRFIAFFSALAAGSTAIAGQVATVSVLDKCRSAVNGLGASMGHAEVKGPDGRLFYKFVLRTAGPDYEAWCDAETGILGDVKPRNAGAESSAS